MISSSWLAFSASHHLRFALWISLGFLAYLGVQTAVSSPPNRTSIHLDPPPGQYEQDFLLTLTPPQTDGIIYYTLNGDPLDSTNRIRYQTPLRITGPAVVVLRTQAQQPDGTLSAEQIVTYLVGIEHTLPILSLVAAPDALWEPNSGIYANAQQSGRAWERPAHLTFFEPQGSGFEVRAGMRIHGGASRLFEKKSFRFYFRNEYGSGDLAYPLFPNSPVTNFEQLILHNGGQDSAQYSANWTLLRTELTTAVSAPLNVYSSQIRPTLLYINGQPWGIYHLRESMNSHFFSDHYGVDQVDFVDSPDRQEPTTAADFRWDAIRQFAGQRDLAAAEDYHYLQTQLDFSNFIDHYILNIYTANTDWPHNNERFFRATMPLSRWRWHLWDLDYSFGLAPSSKLDSNMIQWIMQPEEADVANSTEIMRKLLQNQPEFRNRFLARTADLLNTAFHPDHVLNRVNSLAAQLAPDINAEVTRWSTPGNWQGGVEELRTFAKERPNIVRQHLLEAFALPGTTTLTIIAPPANQGVVQLNKQLTVNSSLTGTYFQATTIELAVEPTSEYEIVGWEMDGELITETAVYTHTVDATPHTFSPRLIRKQ